MPLYKERLEEYWCDTGYGLFYIDGFEEGLCLHELIAYLNFCGCFFMDQRLKERNYVFTEGRHEG
jgi:hypothetical protein